MSGVGEVLIGSVIGLVGTFLGGYLSIKADRDREARAALAQAYRGWIQAASDAATFALDAYSAVEERRYEAEIKDAYAQAESASARLIPFHIELVLMGIPDRIFDMAEEAGSIIRDVRRHRLSPDVLRPKLEAVIRAMGADSAAARQPGWRRWWRRRRMKRAQRKS